MNAKELLGMEVSGKDIVIANYERQKELIEKKVKLLLSPLNTEGHTSCVYYGHVLPEVITYLESKNILTLVYDDVETRRLHNGCEMNVFIPDYELDDKELEEAESKEHECLTESEARKFITEFSDGGETEYSPGDDGYGEDFPDGFMN